MSRVLRFDFGTYDIETESIESDKLEMIGCFDGETYGCFRRIGDFFEHVLRPKYSGRRWFAHYGGRFDVHFLFDFIRENPSRFRGYSLNFYCAGSCVISFTLSKGDCRWRFADSYRLLEASLHTLTHEFDVPHKKLPFAPTDIEYNRNDCMGLYEVLTAYFNFWDITSETKASQAMRVWRARFFEAGPIFGVPRKAEDFIRESYFGGRCEIFRYDEAVLNKLDVNSLYSQAMLQPSPVEYLGYTTRMSDREDRIEFLRARVDYPELYLPALPAIHKGRLFFPVGSFEGVFTNIELREAIADGAAVSIRGGVSFRSERIFSEYIDALYAMKQAAEKDGKPAMRRMAKDGMNSLYGKFGQRREQRCFIFDPGTPRLDMSRPDSPVIWPLPHAEGIAYYERETVSSHILPHISSAVTSIARTITRGHLLRAGRIWYTDTDSVFTDRELPVSTALGDLKLEGRGLFKAYGLKEYIFDDHIHLKGVQVTKTDPTTGEKTEDRDLAMRYFAGAKIEQQRRAGFMESLRSGNPTVRRVVTTRQKGNPTPKRARDGDDTRPWKIVDGELT